MSEFIVWCTERGQEFEDGRSFDAYDAEEAARKWAKFYDSYSAEYAIAEGSEVTVAVRDADGRDSYFVVIGESQPVYYALEVDAASQAAEERKDA